MALAVTSNRNKKLLNNLKTNNNLINPSSSFKTPKRLINTTYSSSSNSTNLNKTKTYLNGSSNNKFSSLTKNPNFISSDLNSKTKKIDELKKPNKNVKNQDQEDLNVKEESLDESDEKRTDNTKSEIDNDTKQDIVNYCSISPEDLKIKEKYFEDKLTDLNKKLSKLKEIGTLGESNTEKNDDSTSLFLSEYFEELNKLARNCEDKLNGLNEWYKRERDEIEETFKLENKKAIQDFNDKQKELKESLKNEHEEMKKQIEIDRNTLDINMDTTEVKPPPTRNLRRRANHNSEMTADSTDFNSSLGIHVTSSVSSASGLLQSSTVLVGSSTSLASANVLTTSHQQSFYSLQQTFYSSNNNLNQALNDRKRKLTAATLAFQLNEDDLNDDLKFLNKSLRLSSGCSPSKNSNL
ncbi:unnamed protein product [Brachionus calyciflorus]|uniref:Uncharacterized protein n=1 Tax=Brachionus calyciflorus TaxID=104777 RepID=A0A813RGW4_9BILA|nr:unnamed protein product [Brachionus calyciflorus]